MNQEGWNKKKVQNRKKNRIGSSTIGVRNEKGKRRIVKEESEMVKIIEEWKEENIRYREKEMEIRIEGETEDIWRNLKKG